MNDELRLLQEKLPFLTLFTYGDDELIGLVQNQSKNVVSVYVLNNMYEQELKKKFIEMSLVWWEESNRKIPINLFFKSDFDCFRKFLVNYVSKEFNVVSGHVVSLQNLNNKRVKRRRTELVVKLDK